jgi:hypothetical protein
VPSDAISVDEGAAETGRDEFKKFTITANSICIRQFSEVASIANARAKQSFFCVKSLRGFFCARGGRQKRCRLFDSPRKNEHRIFLREQVHRQAMVAARIIFRRFGLLRRAGMGLV